MAPILIVFVILIYVFIAKAQKVIRENQRMVVLRLGKFTDLKKPGFHIIVPFIDHGEMIDLQKELPGFKGMSSDQVGDRIIENRFGKEILEKWVKNNRKPLMPNS